MISGGGTGGHIFPAIAIGKTIVAHHPQSSLLYVGALGKMEMERVPAAGFKIEGLWINGIQRQRLWKNIWFPFQLISSLWKSYRLIKQFKPQVVVGVGGFASGPLLEVAARLKVPTLIQEQNSMAGLTNRMLGKKVDKICVAFEGMEKYFPKEKIVFTGNPVRTHLAEKLDQSEAKQKWQIPPSKKVILVVGGSLGARTLNQMMRDNSEWIAAQSDLHIIWQHGKLYTADFGQCEAAKLPNVTPLAFIDDMAAAYASADIVIARAGALTLAELSMVRKPSILVPSPNVAGDHQTHNAMQLVKMGAALLVKDESAISDGLSTALATLKNTDVMTKLSQNMGQYGKKDATESIVQEIVKLVKN